MIETKSLSSNKAISYNKVNSSKNKKSKKNNSCSITLNYIQNPQKCISKFQLNSSKSKKSKFLNKKINIIINNNSIIQSSQPINSSSFSNNMNFFPDEKPIKDTEANSTFVYTGDFSFFDNNNIFNQYLRAEEKKEEKIFEPSQKNSFTLASSINSINHKKSEKNKLNRKLMKLMKKTNMNKNKNNDFKSSNEDGIVWKDNKKNNIKKDDDKLTNNKKRKSLYCFVLFISVNLLLYFFLIMKIFEPCVNKLFFDNDHDNYIYKTSLLSQDTRIIINKK